MMKKNTLWHFWYLAAVFLPAGCVPLVVGGAAMGTGTYYYINGGLQTEYKASYDRLWAACEQTMAEMHAKSVQPVKEIGKGTISAIINEEQVRFDITYVEKNLTSVTVRVGIFGNRTAAQLLHDKISDNLSKS